ncbi:Cas1p-domain-containing protein [Desarmillaria tabescens]|uniref:Cas1p-domain-containing protein n=1 Tax=Armillaria tabescens TaxID=1929756 RepID=A0AA39NFY0_ARMTA|nr:Cas1p-domain-containing protein [Desarmillaria tabescens]KAK0464904.1 Cas1p-domain-containing protein [Desarmillaria tabescens]
MPYSTSLNPSWPNYVGVIGTLLAVVLGLGRYALLDWWDPTHCQALLNSGTWLDQKTWQPDGCMLHMYTAQDVATCAHSREFAFIGDSVTRTLFFQFANIVDPELPAGPPDDDQKHADYNFKAAKSGITVSFHWDPYLNSSRTLNVISADVSLSRSFQRPALLVLGSGLWYLRYADTTGGIPSWEANMERVLDAISRGRSKPADEVVILPVEEVAPSKLSRERGRTIRLAEIDAMNSDLFHRINQPSPEYAHLPGRMLPFMPVSLPLVFNNVLDPAQTQDGLHFSSTIVKQHANILINLRCNDALPKHFPFDKTCCRRYPWPVPMHFVILIAAISWGPWAVFFSQPPGNRLARVPVVKGEQLPLLVFSASVALIYGADRTGLWLKEQKSFNPWTFGFLSICSLAIGFLTVKQADKDLGFLNRDQTDEWKGWMQIAILIYHYLGASKISGIYNPIRVLVAAYLFMTGYGHTTYYIRKADFGFLRVAQVMIRLNMLTLVLAYTMDADYLFYYFAPLVSMWFIIIYATLAIASQFNDRTPILVGKLMLSAAIVTWFMKQDWLLDGLFQLLDQVFGIRWSAREWAFRVNLDLWIVYVGMFTAIGVIKAREHRLTEHPHWPLAVKATIVLAVFVMFWYFAFELTQESKFTYNTWHPYVSFLPVLSFVVLRNCSVVLRSTSSRAFAFIGKCSLETFIIQYHFWLAGDTKGVLLVVPGTRWRPVNFVVTTFLFIFISHWFAKATGDITAWICNDQPKSLPAPATSHHHHTPPVSRQTETPPNGGQDVPLMPMNTDQANKTDTTRQPPRWIDRLAEGSPQSSPRFEGWKSAARWSTGIKARTASILILMWLTNILWTRT